MFSKKLRELRTKKSVQQADMAKVLGVSPQSYSAYENGREPSYDTLIALSRYFDCTTDYLLGLSDARNPEHTVKINEGMERLRNVLEKYGDNSHLRSKRHVVDLLADALNTHWFSFALFYLDSYIIYEEENADQFRTLQVNQKVDITGNIMELGPESYPDFFMAAAQNQMGNTCMQLRKNRIDAERKDGDPNAET